MQLLKELEITAQLAPLQGWERAGKTVERTCIFPGFPEAVAFVNRVAEAAEAASHHPDIDIRWNKVRLVLSSHDAGGLTSLDFEVAHRINDLVEDL